MLLGVVQCSTPGSLLSGNFFNGEGRSKERRVSFFTLSSWLCEVRQPNVLANVEIPLTGPEHKVVWQGKELSPLPSAL